MGIVTCQITMSLDGFVAGPKQSVKDPIGKGGMRLHEWAFASREWNRQHGLDGGTPSVDDDVLKEVVDNVGAYIMGRRMFGGGDGPWDEEWTGWWGEDPPYHVPVFVLTHLPRESLKMAGGTTFHFVTGGIESALALAHAAAGDKNVSIAGGANCINQFLRAGLLDELYLHLAPILLGEGERLFVDVGDVSLRQTKVVAGPTVTHIKYEVVRPA